MLTNDREWCKIKSSKEKRTGDTKDKVFRRNEKGIPVQKILTFNQMEKEGI